MVGRRTGKMGGWEETDFISSQFLGLLSLQTTHAAFAASIKYIYSKNNIYSCVTW